MYIYFKFENWKSKIENLNWIVFELNSNKQPHVRLAKNNG